MLAVIVWLAAADAPVLARERTAMLGGKLALRLPRGAEVAGDGATVGAGDGELTIAVRDGGRAGDDDVRDRMARELGCARVERLAVSHATVAYGAEAAAPRRIGDRALVYAVDAVSAAGEIRELRFYVDAAGLDHARAWAALARASAATLELVLPVQPPIVRVRAQRVPADLPRGWTLDQLGRDSHLTSTHGRCDIVDGEVDARLTAPSDAWRVAGQMRGDAMYWFVWTADPSIFSEAIIGAARWGSIHARCIAVTADEAAAQQATVERLLR